MPTLARIFGGIARHYSARKISLHSIAFDLFCQYVQPGTEYSAGCAWVA